MEMSHTTAINKQSDEALVTAAKQGDTQAFEELVLRHKQRVLAVAQRITNNREESEDVAQESFHRAFLYLNSFQEKFRFSTWLIFTCWPPSSSDCLSEGETQYG